LPSTRLVCVVRDSSNTAQISRFVFPLTNTNTPRLYSSSSRLRVRLLLSSSSSSLASDPFAANDPFAQDELDDAASSATAKNNYVHIRIQQRNGRKTLTTAAGIPQEVNFEKVLKVFKKNFCCNGTIVKDPELGNVVQLQGDQRQNIAKFLITEGIVQKDAIKIHGA
jgi:translation initiation factor 1